MKKILSMYGAILSGILSALTLADTQTMHATTASIQTNEGSRQTLRIGSVHTSQVGNAHSTVTLESAQQKGAQDKQQAIGMAHTQSAEINKIEPDASTGKVKPLAQGGEKQELSIGSIIDSTVTDSASAHITVDNVYQSSNSEVMLGVAKNSNVRKFERVISVHGQTEKSYAKGEGKNQPTENSSTQIEHIKQGNNESVR